MKRKSRAEYKRIYYDKNREKILAGFKKYRADHPDRTKIQNDRWRANNPERKKELDAAYFRSHREQHRIDGRRWRAKDRKGYAEKTAKWRRENPEKMTEARKKWREENPESARQIYTRYRARKKKVSIGDPREITSWQKKWKSKSSVTCAYCLEDFPPKECEADHIIPISRNGPHSLENLAISCRSCNRSKSGKLLSEWKAVISPPF